MKTMTQPLDTLENYSPDTQGADALSLEAEEADEGEAYEFDAEDLSSELPTIVLPTRLMNLEAAGITDVGQNRNHNEDFFIIDNRVTQFRDPDSIQVYTRGLYVLCDGMGGHAQGEVASRMAAETLSLYFADHWQAHMPSNEEIKDAILWANQTLYTLNENQTRLGSGRMGTTLVLTMLQDTQLRFAHVGDSRLYRFTYLRGLEQLTVDHEVGQRDISKGIAPKIAYARPDAYQLTQALGPRPEQTLQVEVQNLTLAEDSLFLLCSDGMTDNDLLERHWETHLRPLLNFRAPLDQGLQRLVELANTENGHDNITVVGIRAQVASQSFSPLTTPLL
jgi:protein phosphatase